jgi:hypothetical protein
MVEIYGTQCSSIVGLSYVQRSGYACHGQLAQTRNILWEISELVFCSPLCDCYIVVFTKCLGITCAIGMSGCLLGWEQANLVIYPPGLPKGCKTYAIRRVWN